MRLTTNQMWAAVLALVMLLAGATTAVIAVEDGDTEVHKKIVRKEVVNCEDGSSEDCEQEVRIEIIGDDLQVVHHGSHYSFDSGIAGQGGFLGVQLTDLTPELRSHFGVADDAGVMVAKVIDDSAAFRAGLMVGDIITRVAGETVGSAGDLTRAIRSRAQGDTVSLELWRDGSLETLSATLDQQEQFGHFAKQVFIDCDDGDCDCSVNGDSIDCDRLHAEHGHGD